MVFEQIKKNNNELFLPSFSSRMPCQLMFPIVNAQTMKVFFLLLKLKTCKLSMQQYDYWIRRMTRGVSLMRVFFAVFVHCYGRILIELAITFHYPVAEMLVIYIVMFAEFWCCRIQRIMSRCQRWRYKASSEKNTILT